MHVLEKDLLKFNDLLVIDVHIFGVGYEVSVATNDFDASDNRSKKVKFYTYLHDARTRRIV